jgi:hypothetical protein
MVRQAWEAVYGDCDQQEGFEAIIVNTMLEYQLAEGPSEVTACRYTGYVEGVLRKSDDVVFDECHWDCASCGHLVGEISAIAYCQMSFAFGGLPAAGYFLRQPEPVCGKRCQAACDGSYNTVTRELADGRWDDPATIIHEGACALYTDECMVLGPLSLYGDDVACKWEPVWNQVRAIQCSLAEP